MCGFVNRSYGKCAFLPFGTISQSAEFQLCVISSQSFSNLISCSHAIDDGEKPAVKEMTVLLFIFYLFLKSKNTGPEGYSSVQESRCDLPAENYKTASKTD